MPDSDTELLGFQFSRFPRDARTTRPKPSRCISCLIRLLERERGKPEARAQLRKLEEGLHREELSAGERQMLLLTAFTVAVLRELQAQPYANPVGRTIFQKICYVVTEMGVPTGFQCGKGNYGPFSGDVKDALHDFSNRNWVQEESLGKMLALRVGPAYEHDRKRFAEIIELHQRKIAKTVDLFSRIKNTEQAEEVMTVMYASRQIKQGAPLRVVEEQQIYDYILDWKKAWNKDEKKAAVASTIRNLVVLGWMRARISETMLEA